MQMKLFICKISTLVLDMLLSNLLICLAVGSREMHPFYVILGDVRFPFVRRLIYKGGYSFCFS